MDVVDLLNHSVTHGHYCTDTMSWVDKVKLAVRAKVKEQLFQEKAFVAFKGRFSPRVPR